MASDNPSWGEERVANELKLKLGIRVSSRTVAKYLRDGRPVRTADPTQRWLTFVHNHAKVIITCDFFVVVTATFRVGVGQPEDRSLQRHWAPDGGMDSAAIPGGSTARPSVPVCDS